MTLLQVIILGLVAGSLLAPLVVSFNLVYATTRVFHFPHATLALFAVYVSSWLASALGMPVWMAVIAGTAFTCIAAIMMARLSYLPLVKRGTSEMGLLMCALGLFLVLEHLTVLMFSPNPISFLDSQSQCLFAVGRCSMTVTQLAVMLCSFAAVAVLWLLLSLTKMGRMIRAYADNAELARVLAVSDRDAVLWSVGIGSLIGAVTMFCQVAYSGILSPEMSMNAAISAAACSTLSGVRRVFLGVPAALLLGVGQAVFSLQFGARWQDTLALALLVAGLALRRRMPLGV